MKLRLAATLAIFVVASCNNKNDDAQNAPDSSRKVASKRPTNVGAHERPSPQPVEAILSIPNRDKLRTSAEYSHLASSLRALSNSDLISLLEKIGETRHTAKDQTTFSMAISELAERDPEAALGWFSPDKISGDEPGLSAVLGSLAEAKPDLLKEWLTTDLEKAPDGVKGEWLSMGLGYLSRADAASALQFWKQLGPSRLSSKEAILTIFGDFAAQSPVGAQAAAEANFKGQELDYARYHIALATKDPTVRFEIATKISDMSSKGMALGGALSQWLTEDRPAALGKLKELDPKDLQAALQATAGEAGSLILKLGKSDPDVLVEVLGSVVASSSTENLFKAAVNSLITDNPDKATALIESMPEGEMKTKMLGTQFRAMASKDSAAALSQAALLTNPDSRKQAYESIGAEVGKRGLEATLKSIGSLSPEDQKPLMGSALVYLNDRDPKQVASLLEDGQVELTDQKRQELLGTVGGSLTRTDSSYATDWLARLPEEQQPHAMKGIAAQMAQSDIKGLSEMLSAQPHDRSWEAGVRVLIDNIKGSDPERATQWQQLLTQAGYK